jgi:hypothetical protein
LPVSAGSSYQLSNADKPVAFPTNNFQALLEIATSSGLPSGIDPASLDPIIQLRQNGALDEATIAYKALVENLGENYEERDLLALAAWLTKRAMELPDEAVITGQALSRALTQERQLRTAENVDTEALKQVQQELEQLRSVVRRNVSKWRLRGVKSTLRGYRELSKAAFS